MKVLLIPFGLIIILGCSDKKTKFPDKEADISIKKENKDSLSIKIVGELRFRRSYAIVQNSNVLSEKVIDREIEKERNSNPWSYAVEDSSVLKRFAELKMTDKNFRLIRSKFKENKSFQFELVDSLGRKLSCDLKAPADSFSIAKYKLIVTDLLRKESIQIEGSLGAGTEDFRYLLLDFVPGCFLEVVVLHEYYIMNGDNSDVFIYQVKYN